MIDNQEVTLDKLRYAYLANKEANGAKVSDAYNLFNAEEYVKYAEKHNHYCENVEKTNLRIAQALEGILLTLKSVCVKVED